jgi:DNA-nicking Smr family endonuclease
MAAEVVSRRRSLSEEEHALWSGVARSITPLRRAKKQQEPPDHAGAAVPSTPVSNPRPVHRAPPAAQKPEKVEKPPPLALLDRRFKQRVANGRTPIDARLDLHGFTQKDAHAALLRFLRGAQAADAKVVLVVTGKGTLRNPRGGGDYAEPTEPGVLRRQVPMWLSLPEFRPFVVSVEDAHVAHGGQGALYVRLRRAR